MFSEVHYRILTHEQWVAKYGSGHCRYLADYYAANRSHEMGQVNAPDALVAQGPEDQENEGPKHDHRSHGMGQVRSQMTCFTGPKSRISPVPPVGTKKVLKKVERESKEQNQNRPHSLSSSKLAVAKNENQEEEKTPSADELFDLVVAVATVTNEKAVFNGKSKAEIVRIIKQTNPTERELVTTVVDIVGKLNDFNLQNAGGAIAAALAGRLLAARRTKEAKERQAANNAVAAQSKKAVEDWRSRVSELAKADINGCARGTLQWEAEFRKAVLPIPDMLVSGTNGLSKIDWGADTTVNAHVARARNEREDQCKAGQPDFYRESAESASA